MSATFDKILGKLLLHKHKVDDVNATGTASSSTFLRGDGSWATPAGSGDMSASTYDPQAIAGDAFARANHTGTQTASTISDFDTEVSNNTDVSANTSARHNALTVTDSSEIDFTLTGQDLTASIVAGSIDETKLDTSVNASLDLADSALQANAVDSVNGQTGTVVLDQDDIGDGTTYKQYSLTEKTKLSNIETSADVTDAVNVGSSIHGATAKATPVDADTMPLIDSAASNVLKKVTWANIKATLKTYFDTLYNLYVHPNHSGDVTSSGDGATTIASNAVTHAKYQQVAADTLLGRTTAGTGDVSALTAISSEILKQSILGLSSTASGYSGNRFFLYDLVAAEMKYTNFSTITNNIYHPDISGLGDSDDHTRYAHLAGRSGGQTLIGGTASGNNLALRSTSNATKGAVVLDSEELFTLGAGVRMVGYDLPTISNPSVLTVTFSYATARVPFITEIYMTVGTSASVNRWGQYARRVVWRTPDTAGGSGIISSDNDLGTASGSNVTFSAPTATTNGFYFTMSTTTSSVLTGRNYMRVVMTGSAGLTVSAVVA